MFVLFQSLFPQKCIFCAKALPAGAGLAICGDCAPLVPFYAPDALFSALGGDGLGGSGSNPDGCDRVVCALRYEGVARAALARYKFRGRPEYGRAFAALLCEKLRRAGVTFEGENDGGAAGFDAVTYVPLSPARERERGYQQARILADFVCAYFRVPGGALDLLRRVPGTPRQSGLTGAERVANARLSFAAREGAAALLPRGARVLLVDDIATTLSTLNACARALKSIGAARVLGGVVAARVL